MDKPINAWRTGGASGGGARCQPLGDWEPGGQGGGPHPRSSGLYGATLSVTEDECGGWCMMAGLDPTLFTVRMKAKVDAV